MKGILVVCGIAILVAMTSRPATRAAVSQELQRGISVQMPQTSHALPAPGADHNLAMLVTITAEGKIYVRTDAVEPGHLADAITRTPYNRNDDTFYIKADARAPYATVIQTIDTARGLGFARIVLLTQQHDASDAGIVPPKGLKVRLGAVIAQHPGTS